MFSFLSTNSKPKQLISWAKSYKVAIPLKPEELEQVTSLDISYKGFSKLPKEIDCLPNLTEIIAPGNDFTELPWEFGHLKKLVRIDLSNNRLTDIQGVICQISKLQYLNLQSNLIKKVSPVIANLINLEELDLSFNTISDLPQEFSHLSHLIKLNLAGNNLSTLPSAFIKLYNLSEVILWKNNYNELPELLKEMPNLKTINTESDVTLVNQQLVLASLTNCIDRASKILQLGADVNYQWEGFHSHSFSTALFAAKTVEMAKLLLDNGADPNLKRPIEKSNGEADYETFFTKKHPTELAKFIKTLTTPQS